MEAVRKIAASGMAKSKNNSQTPPFKPKNVSTETFKTKINPRVVPNNFLRSWNVFVHGSEDEQRQNEGKKHEERQHERISSCNYDVP